MISENMSALSVTKSSFSLNIIFLILLVIFTCPTPFKKSVKIVGVFFLFLLVMVSLSGLNYFSVN